MRAWLSFSWSEGHKNFENSKPLQMTQIKLPNKTKFNDKIKSKCTVPGQKYVVYTYEKITFFKRS